MIFELLLDLKQDLDQLFADAAFRDPEVEDETESGAWISPRIYLGALPPKRKKSQMGYDFPFIVLRTPSGEDQEEHSDISVQIICGIYTAQDEEAGANDIQNMLDNIRQRLLAKRIISRKFELQLPVSWNTGSDEERNQPHPYYLGQIDSTWRVHHAARLQPLDEELETYGSGYK